MSIEVKNKTKSKIRISIITADRDYLFFLLFTKRRLNTGEENIVDIITRKVGKIDIIHKEL